MNLEVLGGGSNARSRGKCQAGQCRIRVGGNWNGIGNSWKAVGKQLERNWKGLENLRGVEGSGGDGSNARKRGECQAD